MASWCCSAPTLSSSCTSTGLPAWLGHRGRARSCVGAVSACLLERTIIRRFYAAPIIAMLGTYRDRAGHPRDRARIARRPLQVRSPSRGPGSHVVGGLEFSIWRTLHHRHDAGGDRRRAGCSSPGPRSACASAARWRTRCSRAPAASPRAALRADLRLRRRRWPGWPAR